MKMSNRTAMLKRLGKRVQSGTLSKALATVLSQAVVAGVATREQVYGFHPTKGTLLKRITL